VSNNRIEFFISDLLKSRTLWLSHFSDHPVRVCRSLSWSWKV